MKAQEIMMFLLLFNFLISVVGALHIYDTGINVNETYNASYFESHSKGTSAVYIILGGTIAAIVGGAIAGALVTGWFSKIPSDAGAAYGIFTGLFLFITLNAAGTLWQLAYIPGAAEYNTAILMIIGIFLAITGVIFVMGLLQMVRGGWKGYK